MLLSVTFLSDLVRTSLRLSANDMLDYFFCWISYVHQFLEIRLVEVDLL